MARRVAHPRERLWLLAIVVCAFAVRVAGLANQSLWRDEVDSLRFATRTMAELAADFSAAGQNGPLYFLALRPWLAVAGPTEFALRFPSVLAGTLAVTALYVLVRRLAGRWAAAVAALLAATAPYLIWYGQEAKMYAALTVLVPLSLWLALEASQRGGLWRWVALYAVTSAAIYTHILAALVIPVQAAWLLLAPNIGMRRRWGTLAAYLLALFLPYLPLVRWQAVYWQAALARSSPAPRPPGDFLAVLAVSFSRGINPARGPWELLPMFLAALAGAALLSVKRPMGSSRVKALLLIWLALPVVLALIISPGLPVLAERYLIWVQPALLALAALGIVALARVWRPLGMGLLGAVLAVNVVGWVEQTARPVKSDFRGAAQYVEMHRRPGDVILYQIPYGRYAFTYYHAMRSAAATPGCLPEAELWFTDDCGRGAYASLPYADGPYTNAGLSADEAAAQMAASIGDAPAVWLVATEPEMWDARNLTGAWLQAHGRETDHIALARVAATR